MLRKGRSIFRSVSLRSLSKRGGDGSEFVPPNLKRKASKSVSAIKDTYFSTKQVFENHRVVFTVGTSIASILTVWAGYSIREHHQNTLNKRLDLIEKSMKENHSVEHEEIKRIVTSGNVSTAACIVTTSTALIIGYGLGWRGESWYANRKFRREQLKLMGKIKPNRWRLLRRPFVRLRKTQVIKNAGPELPSSANATTSLPPKQTTNRL